MNEQLAHAQSAAGLSPAFGGARDPACLRQPGPRADRGGAGGLALVFANRIAPRMMDRAFALLGRPTQTTKNPGIAGRRDNLYEPRADEAERSSLRPLTRKTSLALQAQLHPTATLVTGAALAFGFLTTAWAPPARRS